MIIEIKPFLMPTYGMLKHLFSFNKKDQNSGKLIGIKGQYLIFDHGRVVNIRKHNGYEVELMIK